MRAQASLSKDKRYFTRTASSVKAVNLPVTLYRGGFRF